MSAQVVRAIEPRELVTASQMAVYFLRKGEVVGMPSETVYGLAGDALNPLAAARIFEAKERPSFDPLICHVRDFSMAERVADFSSVPRDVLTELIERYWPGPLTLVVPKRSRVPDIVTSGQPSVAVRCPSHLVFRSVIEQLDHPVAAPSANRFGRISPTTAGHVFEELGGRIPLILDGGECRHGVESTIVRFEGGRRVTVLRPGPVTEEDLLLLGLEVSAELCGSAGRLMPGQVEGHYAPRTPMVFAGAGLELPVGREGVLVWRTSAALAREMGYRVVVELCPELDLLRAAANLFSALRRLDAEGLDRIVVEGVPEVGVGVAVMDRLRRAVAGSGH
jgi:L-threonylcarbamoyladenylate synthase